MKKILLVVLFFLTVNWSFGQEIISRKDKISKIEDLTYTIVHFKDGGNGRSEVLVDIGDGVEWKFYDKTARKLRWIFISKTDLLNFMYKEGWKLVEFESLKPNYKSMIFMRRVKS
jgi:hypothetical protein